MRGDSALMRQTADAALAAAETWSDPAFACVAHRMQGVTRWLAEGDIVGALAHFEQSAAHYDPERDRESAFRFGQDSGVAAKAYLAVALWLNGKPDPARAAIEQMMALAVKIEHAPTLAYAHYHSAMFETMRLDAARVKLHTEQSAALAREHGISLWQLLCPVLHGWALGSLDGAEAGLDEMGHAIAACRQQGLRAGSEGFLPLFAFLQAKTGRVDDALDTVATAIADIENIHFWDAEVYRTRGEILLKVDPANHAAAEEAFQTAIAVAGEQKARSFGLRAALSLATFYQSIGRTTDAHAVLAPALDGFAPTPEFPEIAEAQALLTAAVTN